MNTKEKALFEKAARQMSDLIQEVDQLKEKVAHAERVSVAEDIALMKAAEGVIPFEELLDERDRLVSSKDDLIQIKTAMQHFGPGKVGTAGTVSSETARVPFNSVVVPDYIEQAQRQLEEAIAAL